MSEQAHNYTPTQRERLIAGESLQTVKDVIRETENQDALPELLFTGTGESIKLPVRILKMLAEILKNHRDGNAVTIVPTNITFTTQKAAEFLNCSRPHVIKLIDEGKLNAEFVGRHRRIQLKDLKEYKKKMIGDRRRELSELMREAKEIDLYKPDKESRTLNYLESENETLAKEVELAVQSSTEDNLLRYCEVLSAQLAMQGIDLKNHPVERKIYYIDE